MVQKQQLGLMVSQKNEEELDAFLSGKTKAAPVRGTRRAKSEPAGPWYASYLATGGVLAFFTFAIFHSNGIAKSGDVRGSAIHNYASEADGILDFDDIYDDDGVVFDDDYNADPGEYDYANNPFVDDYYDDDVMMLDDGGYYNDEYMNNGDEKTPLGEVCAVDSDCTSVSCFMADVGFSYCHCTVCDTGGCGGCGMGKHCKSFNDMLPNVCVRLDVHKPAPGGGRMRRAASTRGGPTEAAQDRRRRGSTPHRA